MSKRNTWVLNWQDWQSQIPASTRKLHETDTLKLGKLLYESYKGTPDYNNETLEDSALEAGNILHGDYGDILFDYSFVCEHENEFFGGVIVTEHDDFDGPLVIFVMTTAAHKRKGLAYKLLRHALASIFSAEKSSVYTRITEGNVASENLFKKLGFQRI